MYHASVREALESAFQLQKPPSKDPNHHEKPHIEYSSDPTLLHEPVLINSSSKVNEKVSIERSVNSTRISILIKQSDSMDQSLCKTFMRSLMRRAEDFYIIRRLPLDGYSITFLITNHHLGKFKRNHIIDFIMHFMNEVDREISEMKISVNARARRVASDYVDLLAI